MKWFKGKSQKSKRLVMHEDKTRIANIQCGRLLSGCIIGANHLEKNNPCQDASIASIHYFKGQPYTLLAVADGHGSERYTRSELGAHFAIQAVIDAAADWVLFTTEYIEKKPENWLAHVRHEFGSRFAKKLRQTWLNKVTEHLAIYPLTDEEGEPEKEHLVYGTTVALAIIFQGQVFVGAIGDSSVLIITDEDEALDVLAGYQQESEPLGLTTHSLTQEDAALKWKHNILAVDKIQMLCAVTDGFTDSLADVSQTLGSLHNDARNKGFDWLESNLPEFLDRLTYQGVGDDIATVFYFPPETEQSVINENSGVDNE